MRKALPGYSQGTCGNTNSDSNIVVQEFHFIANSGRFNIAHVLGECLRQRKPCGTACESPTGTESNLGI